MADCFNGFNFLAKKTLNLCMLIMKKLNKLLKTSLKIRYILIVVTNCNKYMYI